MGTRGSSSHGGRGGGGPPFARVGRDQLAPWRDNATAFQQILRDTGYTQEQARIAQEAQIRFYGDDYDTFTSGDLPHETEIISEALQTQTTEILDEFPTKAAEEKTPTVEPVTPMAES